jgi:hypothetical protein
LPKVIRAVRDGLTIYVCEGEKDVQAMVKHGFEATTNPSGKMKWREEYSETLRGADTVIIADKDNGGREHAQDVATRLSGVAGFVRVIELPGAAVKDPFDFFEVGGTADQLQKIADAAPERKPRDGTSQNKILVRTLDQFTIDPETNGGCILGNRWICRGGGLLLAAPTGIGKTTFVLQAAIMWTLGRDHFGIKPFGRLRVLIVQAENDDGDMAEIRDGIFLALDLSEQERREACARIKVVCESAATGLGFVAMAKTLIAEHRPDLLVIDPFFSYLGDSVSDQKAVSAFLRNGMNPILQEYGCALILVHHTNKPLSGREKPDWRAGDYAYLGSGSAEIANWSRGVMAIRAIGSHTIFDVQLGKRGKRAGLVNDDGETIYQFYIKHIKGGGICWQPATDADFVSHGKGTPKKHEDVYRLLPMTGDISQPQLFEAARAAHIGRDLTRNLLEEMIDGKIEGMRVFVWLKPRPGTRPAKSYSRQEQELIK